MVQVIKFGEHRQAPLRKYPLINVSVTYNSDIVVIGKRELMFTYFTVMFLFLCGFPIRCSKIGLHVVENKIHVLEVSVQYSIRNEIVFEFNAVGALMQIALL
jgi:hypothetical protein